MSKKNLRERPARIRKENMMKVVNGLLMFFDDDYDSAFVEGLPGDIRLWIGQDSKGIISFLENQKVKIWYNKIMTNFVNTALAHTLESGEADLSGVHHGFGIMGGYGYPMVFFGWIFMLLFLTLLILAVVALVKYIKG